MTGRIRAEDIAAVRDRVRIDEVISDHVTLRPAGAGSWKGLCPFHEERTPSFHVSSAKGFYYCFGCEEGGDAIDFLMSQDHLTFSEAVEKLAGRVGIVLRYQGGSTSTSGESGNRRVLLRINRITADFFARSLTSDAAGSARRLLADRGFPEAAWEQFQVGYAPRAGLLSHLREQGFGHADLLASGVVGQGDRGLYDRFRDRLVWPIQDLSGDVIGFGARRLKEDAGPKYLNTPETAVYKKGQVLYGLFQAKKQIAKDQQVVVVEGYTDVMACRLAGIGTTVATCGTAFGSGHVSVLRRILMDDARSQVVFTFDGDAAGRRAALRAYRDDQQFAAHTYVAIAKNGLDPCDLRMRHGDEAVRDMIDAKRPLFEFVLRSAVDDIDLVTAEGRAAGIRAVAPVIASMKDPTLQPEYARQVSGWLGVEPDQVMAAVRRSDQPASRSGSDARRTDGDDREDMLERLVLRTLLQHADLIQDWIPLLTMECFVGGRARAAFSSMESAVLAAAGDAGWVRRVLDECRDDQERRFVHALVAEPLPGGEPSEARATGLVARLLDRAEERNARDLRAALGAPDLRQDLQRQQELLRDLMAVEQYRRELRPHWAGDQS